MPPETCGICGATVALGDAAHVMLNAKSEEGVRDYYVCPTCFEEELVPHFPDRKGDGEEAEDDVESGDSGTGTEESAVDEPTDSTGTADPTTDAGE